MNSSQRFIGCYVSKAFLDRIQGFMEKNGYNSKSELIRSALRRILEEELKDGIKQ